MKTKRLIKAQKGIQIPIPGLYGTMGHATAQMTPAQNEKMIELVPGSSIYDIYKAAKNPTKNNIKNAVVNTGLDIMAGTSGLNYLKILGRANKIRKAGKMITLPKLIETDGFWPTIGSQMGIRPINMFNNK